MGVDDPLINSQFLLILKLVLAFVAGTLIGIEREKHGRPADYVPIFWCVPAPA